MTAEENPLLSRIRAGLDWPNWSSWPDSVTELPAPPGPFGPVNAAARTAEVQRRRALAKTTDRGGPWLELFDGEVAGRLAAEGDTDLGPLADWTFAVKALMAVDDKVTTAGSPVRADAAPESASAPFVRMLEAAGAIALGSVTMHEFAFGVTGVNDHAGTAPNPGAPGRAPGGSSSGSASAVASGSARFAIGTDTGGSVRIPSAFCGIAGFKPAHGTYPAAGVFPLSTTLDHVGLHATSIADIATIHAALGYDASPTSSPTPAAGLRIGVARADVASADDEVRHAIETALDALREAGAELIDVELPDAEATFVASSGIMFSEAAAIHATSLAEHGDRYGADIRTRLELGATLTGPQVAAAHRLRAEIIGQVQATLAGVDVIASPTVPIVAPLLTDCSDPAVSARIVANTRLGNVVGLPVITTPAPSDTPPVGLQLLGATNQATLAAGLTAEAVLAS